MLPLPVPIPTSAPAWADAFGSDQYGAFAEFGIGAARFPMRWIPPGSFLMGSPENEPGRWETEGSQHSVTIVHGFWLGKTPVTQAQWAAVMNTSPSRDPGPHRPVHNVSWNDCVEFCEALKTRHGIGATLPFEAEWEHACRAGTSGIYGTAARVASVDELRTILEPLGWYEDISDDLTHDVAQRAPNAWGLYDMHGNVDEWCRDGQRQYSAESATTPKGKRSGLFRVTRGGSWLSTPVESRAAARFVEVRFCRLPYIGFRLRVRHETGVAEKARP